MWTLLFEPPHGKTKICIGENKDADQLRGYSAKLISAFVFATRKVQFLFYLNPKFQASSSFLCLHSSVCVRPVRKPHCWFSHEAAHFLLFFSGSPPLRKLAHAIYRDFLALKIENFQLKNFDIFLIFAQNIDCGYTLEPPR